MSQRIFSIATRFAVVLAVVAGFSSCKEDIIIKSDLTPSTDNVGTYTFIIPEDSLVAQTIKDDTMQTSTLSATYAVNHALGWLNEGTDTKNPYPTTVQGDVAFQVVPTTVGFNYASGDAIDSAVIVLPYAGFSWGDTSVKSDQTITVYELTDTMSNKSKYYTTSVKNYDAANPIGTATFSTGPVVAGSRTGVIGDSVIIGNNKKVAPHLRIKLSGSFLTRFNTLVGKHVSTMDSFLMDLKGFYLKPDVTKPGRAMPYFRINGNALPYDEANLLVYAHNGANDSIYYQFPFNTTYTAHYNKIKRTYQNQAIFNPGSTELMVQNQPGAAIDFTIKGLRSFAPLQGNVVINKVELIFTEIPAYAQLLSYTRPPRIYPIGIDQVNVRYGLADRLDAGIATQAGLDFINGTPYTNTTTNTTTYSINFPREFQQCIIQQKSELHLRINGTQTYPAAYRLIAGNKNNPNANYRYALKVTYSKQ